MFVVSKGDTRRVIAVPRLGIVFKFPRIYWAYALNKWRSGRARHRLYKLGKKQGKPFSEFLREQFVEDEVDFGWTIKAFLFGGVLSNWRERKYCKCAGLLHRLFLQPTYFSFFGLVNVQRYGKPLSIEDSGAMYSSFFEIAGRDLNADGHHWLKGKNFHLAPDGPKALDYAHKATQRVIDVHGLNLYRHFDLEAGRKIDEEHLKKLNASFQPSNYDSSP